jgi:hypothetical protein
MLDLPQIDIEEIATALADQTEYEHRWLIDARTGEVVFWTSDTGVDGENPVEIDEPDLIAIDPLPSCVWFKTWPTSLTASATAVPADSWPMLSRAGRPFDDSSTSSMSVILN